MLKKLALFGILALAYANEHENTSHKTSHPLLNHDKKLAPLPHEKLKRPGSDSLTTGPGIDFDEAMIYSFNANRQNDQATMRRKGYLGKAPEHPLLWNN